MVKKKLKKLINEEILEKNYEHYQLSKNSEKLIPYLSDKNPVLPVVLIHLGNNKECFLKERTKRPFEKKLSLPGGRLTTNESIPNCVKRIMKEKYNLEVKLKKINSISIEQVLEKKEIVHSFLLIFVTVESKEKIPLIPIIKNKSKIISSDYSLLRNNLSSEIDLKTITTRV